jgi:hypothetical protein
LTPVGLPVEGGGAPVTYNVLEVRVAGDRTSPQDGATALRAPGQIELSSWELKQTGCCESFCLKLRCSDDAHARSYLYIRNNQSIEINDANASVCCSCCFPGCRQDNASVFYFDRAPFSKNCRPAPFPCCCFCGVHEPKLEVVDRGCLCCCVHVDPCCKGKEVVLMPFEYLACPCCCLRNRVDCCNNCCGCCGPITGNPRIYTPLKLQPTDAEAFVAAAQRAMIPTTDSMTRP